MGPTSDLKKQAMSQGAMVKRALTGAGVGLALITIFLSGKIQVNPAWGKYWMVKPLLMMTFAGAMAGLCFYLINYFFGYRRWPKSLGIIISLLVGVIGLFFGFVLGLNGTLWN